MTALVGGIPHRLLRGREHNTTKRIGGRVKGMGVNSQLMPRSDSERADRSVAREPRWGCIPDVDTGEPDRVWDSIESLHRVRDFARNVITEY